MGRVERITEEIRKHDYKLYCEKSREGKLCIFRKSTRAEQYYLDDNTVITYIRPTPHFICALTDNWKFDGREVEWGLLPIMERLRAMDLWKRDIASEIIENEERIAISNERARNNSMESFLYDARDHFKKDWKDINTSSLSKKPKRRIKEI